jgi:hypothetical protein
LASRPRPEAGPIEGGYIAAFAPQRQLGFGWRHVAGVIDDSLARSALPLLACHAPTRGHQLPPRPLLREREDLLYDSLIV